MGFWIHVGVSCGLLAVLAVGLHLIVKSGVYSVASAAFFMVGAYATAIGTGRLGMTPVAAALLGATSGLVLGLVCIAPAFRVKEDRLLVLTLAFAETLRLFALNRIDVTEGAMGISGIGALTVLGIRVSSSGVAYPAVLWLFVAGISFVSSVVLGSPWGHRLAICREDEVVARSLGIAPTPYRYVAHSAGAALSALAGSFYAHYMGFVSPSPFSLSYSVLVLAAAILGERWGVVGVVVTAAGVGLALPLLQLAGLSAFSASAIRQVLFGGLLTAIVLGSRRVPASGNRPGRVSS
jgi:branched-chain amino acid transport system permease protein